jgi:hypothetical protein
MAVLKFIMVKIKNMETINSPIEANQSRKRDEVKYDDYEGGLSKAQTVELMSIETEVQSRLMYIKRDVYEIGKLLSVAKGIVSHGEFEKWIEKTFGDDLPYSTANYCMRVYMTFEDKPSLVTRIPSKYLLMVTQKSFPDQIVQLLKDNPDMISPHNLSQVKTLYEDYKKGILESNVFLKLAGRQIRTGLEIKADYNTYRINGTMRRPLHRGIKEMMDRIEGVRIIVRDMNHYYPPDVDSPEHKEIVKLLNKSISELSFAKFELERVRSEFTQDFGPKHISTPDGNKLVENSKS